MIVVAEGNLRWDEVTQRFDPDRSDVALPVLTKRGVLPTEPLYVGETTRLGDLCLSVSRTGSRLLVPKTLGTGMLRVVNAFRTEVVWMAMFLIAGSFRVMGAQPDGDSIRFTPDNPGNWDLITGPNRVRRNAGGAAQLRLDAIDALETHYGNPRTHQPLGLAHAAAAELLDWLGFQQCCARRG